MITRALNRRLKTAPRPSNTKFIHVCISYSVNAINVVLSIHVGCTARLHQYIDPSGGCAIRRLAELFMLLSIATITCSIPESRVHAKPCNRPRSTTPLPFTQSSATHELNRTLGGTSGYCGPHSILRDRMRPSSGV